MIVAEKCFGLSLPTVFRCCQFGFHFDRPNVKVCLNYVVIQPLVAVALLSLVHLLMLLLCSAEVKVSKFRKATDGNPS